MKKPLQPEAVPELTSEHFPRRPRPPIHHGHHILAEIPEDLKFEIELKKRMNGTYKDRRKS